MAKGFKSFVNSIKGLFKPISFNPVGNLPDLPSLPEDEIPAGNLIFRGGDGRKATKHYAEDDNTKTRRLMAKQSRRINRGK